MIYLLNCIPISRTAIKVRPVTQVRARQLIFQTQRSHSSTRTRSISLFVPAVGGRRLASGNFEPISIVRYNEGANRREKPVADSDFAISGLNRRNGQLRFAFAPSLVSLLYTCQWSGISDEIYLQIYYLYSEIELILVFSSFLFYGYINSIAIIDNDKIWCVAFSKFYRINIFVFMI